MKQTTTENTAPANRPREQKLVLYHPSSAGNGSAFQLEPRFNRRGTDRYNCFFLELANQKTTASMAEGRKVPATFDWENKLTVKLDFSDLCEFLCVLEGRSDKAGGQRNGLYHDNGEASTLITFQRNTEKGGYFVSLSRKSKAGAPARAHFLLGETEAAGLRALFQTGLFFMVFHGQLFPAPVAGPET